MENLPSLVGRKFGRLTVLSFSHSSKHKRYWNCECECTLGKVVQKPTGSLTSGKVKSCGCLGIEHQKNGNVTHGQTIGGITSEYEAWQGMFKRCYNHNTVRFENHGGRGIEVCERWKKFENFFEDMGKKPTPKHSLDRINNDGNYEPSNCRWATPKEQCYNRRSTRFIEYNGVTKILQEWSDFFGLSKSSTLSYYIKKHGVEKAMLHYANRNK